MHYFAQIYLKFASKQKANVGFSRCAVGEADFAFPQIQLRIALFLLIIAACFTKVQAQTEEWYTSDGYLSSSLISSVLYDSNGMLWITTEDCLNRFDGSKFTIYRNNPEDPTSIANNRVNGIFEDRDGNLYVCTHAGVQLYNPATDSFSEPLKVKGQQGQSSPLSAMVQRPDGELWAVGNEVYRVIGEKGHQELEHMDLPDEIRFIFCGISDAYGNIWLSKNTDGLYRILPNGSVRHYFGKNDDPVITSMAVDKKKRLYVGSAKQGLYRYNTDTDSFDRINLGEEYEGYGISAIYPDEYENVLIGTDGSGLLVYNTSNEDVSLFPFRNLDFDKLKIHGLAKDTYGNLWIGVHQKGLMKEPKRSPFFKSIDQRVSNLIGTCCVTSIYRDKDGILWVGTDNDDIFAVDLNNQTSKHFTIGVPATVMCIFEDSGGTMWLGSYNRGTGWIDKTTGKFTPIKLERKGIDARHVYDFAELPDGDLLIATMGLGLFRYNKATDTSTPIRLQNLSDWVTSVEVNPANGEVYVGTYDGFFILSPDLKEAKQVLNRHIISAIHLEPAYDDIWLGTNEGLARVDYEGEVKRIYTESDGLPSHSVLAIEHGDDALWLSTPHGLSKFNVAKGTFTNFTVNHGLPNNEFSRNSSYKDSKGNIYFGGINGVTSFKASDINVDGKKLNLRITDFIIGNKSVNATTRSGSRQVIDCPITEATNFKLNYDDNSFSIRINTREFINSSQAEFYYSFDDDDWMHIQSTNSGIGGVTLTFTNVASGKHTLRVKAVNGGVESEELTVTIDISTVWYATWWAKLLYLLIFAGICYLLYRQWHARMLRRREEQDRKHKSEILESKLQFFTNISHEIRTPLSLVIGPLQKLQETDTDAQRSSSYRTILRNANRILRLVNELMDLRKIDNKLMKLHFKEVNLVGFVNDLYETFSQAAAAKDIDFTFTHEDKDEIKGWIDTTNFDKIVMNLLSNAIKFTPEHGKINIDLHSGTDESTEGPLSHYIELSVTDSGIGISKEERENVFNRFFQASNNKAGGTGIGLHLTSQLVELHHGTIEIMDNPDGKGTRFVVRIPADSTHLQPEELSVSPIIDSTEVSFEEIHNRILEQIQEIPEESIDDAKIRTPRGNDIVYVVEDDEEIRNYLVSNLSRHFHTYGYSNGKAALEAIHERCPSLVITDVMMPEMDGYTLTKKIKQNINLNRIPVIILTARTREEDNLEAIESGAAVYISKPFNMDVVIRTAQSQIESVARLRNAFSGSQTQEDKLEDIEVASNDDKLMERVMKVINKNLSNSDITVEMIAQEIGISRVHLHRKLKEITNQSTRDFIRNIRLQAAAKLLREKKLTVAEVSDLVGFKQPNNFSTVFKEMFGISPTAYSAKYHDN